MGANYHFMFNNVISQLNLVLGMNMSTAVTIFVKTVVRERKIPFEISAPIDGFYHEYNQARLRKTMEQLNGGKLVTTTLEVLEIMENE